MPSLASRRTLAAAVVAFLVSPASAWSIKSRELVDVEMTANGSLSILVSAPGAEAPGLYVWRSGAIEPVKVCAITAPSFFSFDRRIVIERVHGEHDSLRLYDAANCAVLGQIETTGRVIDADAMGSLVAAAVQYPDEERTLELYTKRGKRIAKTEIGRNVELGFAPDGKTLLNFDLSDAPDTNANAIRNRDANGSGNGNATWQLRSLARAKSPVWMNKGEMSFIPGSHYLKHYANGALSIVPWATGKPKYTNSMARTVRVRQLSGDGRYGVIHERLAQTDSTAWIDFATGTRVPLGEGSIDHAAINASGTKVAWTQRSGPQGDDVNVVKASVSATGKVTLEN